MGGPSTFYTCTRLFKRRLHIPTINLSAISDSQQHLCCDEKQVERLFIYYFSRKKYSILTLSINGKAILTFWMIISFWENFFCYLILLHSNLMLRLSSIKCFIIYSIQRKNDSNRYHSRQRLYFLWGQTRNFANALTQSDFGTIFSLIHAFYQINRFVFHCRMLYLVSYLSNALQPNY